MPEIGNAPADRETVYPVSIGWQWRAYLDEKIVGGWAPTKADAERRRQEAVQDAP